MTRVSSGEINKLKPQEGKGHEVKLGVNPYLFLGSLDGALRLFGYLLLELLNRRPGEAKLPEFRILWYVISKTNFGRSLPLPVLSGGLNVGPHGRLQTPAVGAAAATAALKEERN